MGLHLCDQRLSTVLPSRRVRTRGCATSLAFSSSSSWSEGLHRERGSTDDVEFTGIESSSTVAPGATESHGRSGGVMDGDGDFWDGDLLQGAAPEGGSMLLSEEEDESEWMEGEDVDPIAEKIFYGEKVPFRDLGERREVGVMNKACFENVWIPNHVGLELDDAPSCDLDLSPRE